jgi:alcohol dehydrogenase
MHFNVSRTPHLIFGSGSLDKLPAVAGRFGKNLLLVTGGSWLQASGTLDRIKSVLCPAFNLDSASIHGEPSPAAIDTIVSCRRDRHIDCVVAIGGGSVVDAGKAIAAMLTVDSPVIEYLEDVGSKVHPGTKVGCIAIPTTAGTGSEATKNAVLSVVGPQGFKKSLRHDNFVPDIAIVDPALSMTCGPALTASCGLDALAQLLESFFSTAASPLTDSLAFEALHMVIHNIVPACTEGSKDISVRAAMSYGAYISGVTLANAGLGIVHGIAGPLGGLHPIPHGVICGTLLAPSMRVTLDTMRRTPERFGAALEKFSRVGRLFDDPACNSSAGYCEDLLIDGLERLTRSLGIPTLSDFGLTDADCDAIIAVSASKNNPVKLDNEEMRAILHARLT